MIEVEITIGGHKFRIACAKGEEDQLDTAAKLLDREALALQSVNGRVPETKMLLMAGLMLGDKIKSLEWEKASVQKDLSEYKKEIESLKTQVDNFQNQTALDFEDDNKKHLANGDEDEILLLLKNTADTLDNVLSKFSDLKDKHSTDSSKVIEAVEGAFK